MRVRRWEWLAVAGILLVATMARIFRLDASLWYDEIVTLVNFVRLPTLELIAAFDSPNNHMFYSLQAQAAIAAFSESAWSLRLPAVLAGLASLVVWWTMGRRAIGRTQALVAASLLAISYHHVWFSQNARGYTGLLFWTALATLLFAQGLDRPAWRTWGLYGACVAAAIYTHLSALFFFAGHGVVYLALLIVCRAGSGRVAREGRFAGVATRMPIVGFALAAALTLLLHAPILRQVLHTVEAKSTGARDPASALAEWFSPLRAAQEVIASLSSAGPLAPAILIGATAAFVIGAVSLARRQPVLTAVYLLHVPIALGILLVLHSRIWPRYFFVDIGFAYLGIVHGVFVLSGWLSARLGMDRRWPRAAGTLTAAAVAVMTAGSLWLLAGNYTFPKQDFRGAVAYVERERLPGDAVASLGLARLPLQRYFAPGWSAVDSVAELDALSRSASAVWVVIAFPHQTHRAKPELAAILDRDFDRVAMFPGTLGDGAIWVYRSR
jgi:uncharacterized membrane protein